ncbi:aminopeptidase P family protein [uncultured Bradyrhizobium sp.]|uniref:aminopeptidase P family protein n=1 Tax=uncultured Bradyrhizobium sp. TaxID=199684 RepID=UPI0035C97A59
MTAPSPTDRLAALRAKLRQAGFQAFLVPRADAHQNEYVAPSDERLRFISGFSGTAGFAAITMREAALFTDGRYRLQAERQIDGAHWSLLPSEQNPSIDWLSARLSAGDVIGYDPRLHRVDEIDRLSAAFKSRGIKIAPVVDNPIDAIWLDRPASPAGAVILHAASFAGETAAEKRHRVAEQLAREGVDALLVSAPDSLSWLFNIRGSDLMLTPVVFGFALLRQDATAVLFLDPAKITGELAEALTEGGAVSIAPPSAMVEVLTGFAPGTVRLDNASASVYLADLVRAAGAKVDVGIDPIVLMKAQKSATELAGIRAAHHRDGVALTRFLAWFAREAPGGLTEWTAAKKLYDLRAGLTNFRSLSFPTISAAAGNAAEAHYQLTDTNARPFADGDIYLVDSGAQFLDGTTDVTRVTVIGTPTEEMRRRYTQVLKGHVALSRARFPKGVSGAQLDPLARQFLWADGVDFQHGTGHGVGFYLSVHEGPQSISARGAGVPLLPGMVVSVEPGYYKRDAFGIRVENLVAVREAAEQPDLAEQPLLEFETLTIAPYERRLIDLAMLTEQEVAWVNSYHAWVGRNLASELSGQDLDYLITATKPLA